MTVPLIHYPWDEQLQPHSLGSSQESPVDAGSPGWVTDQCVFRLLRCWTVTYQKCELAGIRLDSTGILVDVDASGESRSRFSFLAGCLFCRRPLCWHLQGDCVFSHRAKFPKSFHRLVERLKPEEWRLFYQQIHLVLVMACLTISYSWDVWVFAFLWPCCVVFVHIIFYEGINMTLFIRAVTVINLQR